MSNPIQTLAERRMLAALAKGELTGLQGEGQPLPERPGDAFISAADAVGFRIMAEAGVLPEEIGIAKQIERARAEFAALTEPEARKAAQRKLADLETRRAMAQEARKRFLSD